MSYIGNQPSQVAFLTDTFSGNGSTTAFTMSVAPANTASVLVAVSGVLQDPSTYSVVGTTLTFSGAPPTGTGNISARYLGIPASGVTTTAYRTVTEFTATAGQTTFTPPSYTVGFINVYRNGVRLGSADYTASNGTTIVFATGATSGDLVTVESFLVSSVLNAIPAAAASIPQAYLASGVAGTGPTFQAVSNAGQTLTNNTQTKIAINSKTWDTASAYDTTNYRFLPPVAGYYQVNGYLYSGAGSTNTQLVEAVIYKNGATTGIGSTLVYSSVSPYNSGNANISALVYLNGSTDYIELWGRIVGTGTLTFSNNSVFQAALVRSA